MRPRAHQLDAECTKLIVESLRACESGDEAKSWLKSQGLRQLVEQMAAENFQVLSELEETSKVVTAVINKPEIIHFAKLAEVEKDSLKKMVSAVRSPIARKHFPLSGIWSAYADALSNFHENRIQPIDVKTAKGFEKYIVPYIEFMTSSSLGSRESARQKIHESFMQRNRGQRLRDWRGLDGDGERPVKWDFRLYALEH